MVTLSWEGVGEQIATSIKCQEKGWSYVLEEECNRVGVWFGDTRLEGCAGTTQRQEDPLGGQHNSDSELTSRSSERDLGSVTHEPSEPEQVR